MEGINHNIDQTKVMTFTTPGNVVIDILTTESGLKPGEKPTLENRLIVLDSMTPETETTCHYFFGGCRNYRIDSAELTEMMHKTTIVAFNEDKDMLEAQQSVIELAPDAPTLNVHADWGGVQARRLVTQLIAGEAQGTIAAQ